MSTSCTTAPELMEENERLRKENGKLSHELTHLRGLFNGILALMTNFASGQLDGGNLPEGKPLELIPARQVVVVAPPEDVAITAAEVVEDEEEEASPRLFGVSIGVKRARRDEEEEEEKNHRRSEEREPGGEVKSEPFDGNSDHHDSRWLELGK